MKIVNMAETVLRTTLRTSNMAQLSPTPSLSNTSISTHISNASYPLQESTSGKQSPNNVQNVAQRLQLLKQRKTELEKILLEKNSLLQQLSRQEAQIIGCYDFDQTGDGKSSTLRRKVGTAFKLPENLLNGSGGDKEDEIKQLLLGKQIQQQISEASLKLANDLSQTKSIRRTHKNNYETAQQKLNAINQSLSALQKRQNVASSYQLQMKQQPSPTATKSVTTTTNNNFLQTTSQLSPSQLNNNNFIGSASNQHQLLMKTFSGHGNISPNINNNHHGIKQRRNSLISTTSSTNLDITIPTTPNSSRIRHENYGAPFESYHHYNSGSNNNKSDLSISTNSINQSKHKMKPVLLDNDYNLLRYSPLSCETEPFSYHNHFNQYSPDDIKATSPTSPLLDHLMATNQLNNKENQQRQFAIPISHRQTITAHHQAITLSNDGRKYGDINVCVDEDSAVNRPLNGQLISPPLHPKGTLMIQQGLGGYWMTLENNERVWCSVDRFASLDRKGQSLKLRKQHQTLQKQPTISTSLGNIEHIARQTADETLDSVSISSMNSDQKKFKEKPWIETSLDYPTTKANEVSQRKLMTPSPPPPILHQREKKKLSSQSMHSPGRSNYLYTVNAANQHDKQMQKCILDKNFSHSSSTLAQTARLVPPLTDDNINHSTKPQPIPPKQPYPLPSPTTLPNISSSQNQQRQLMQQHQQLSPKRPPQQQLSPTRPPQQQLQLRRTASSVSSTSMNLLNSPTNIRIESPKNMTIVQPAKFQPYKEESKPFEMSDFYKYSTKFRQKNIATDNGLDG